jgi:hypothetical protein
MTFSRDQSSLANVLRDVRLNSIPANIILHKPSSPAILPREKGAGSQRPAPLGRGPRVRNEGEGQRYVIYLPVLNWQYYSLAGDNLFQTRLNKSVNITLSADIFIQFRSNMALILCLTRYFYFSRYTYYGNNLCFISLFA